MQASIIKVMKISFALITFGLSQTLQVRADEASEYKVIREVPNIPVSKPNGLPKDTPVGDLRSLPARGFSGPPEIGGRTRINNDAHADSVNKAITGKILRKESNAPSSPKTFGGDVDTIHAYPTTYDSQKTHVGDFGTARTYPITNSGKSH